MDINVEDTALVRFLKAKKPAYFGKFLEVRKEVGGWLAYTVQTFPHYTRHTLDHTDQIILQLSHLIFNEGKTKPTISRLSATDAYILVMAALLHDAGMVASDQEKAEILANPEFQSWIKEARAAEWAGIAKLRQSHDQQEQSIKNFLADVELRRLVAEHIRRKHHERAYHLIEQHDLLFGRVSFGDHQLQEAIAVVCLGHGLTHSELDDSARYPLVRQIAGEQVHLRLLAVLFRLGDLLDMSVKRACPLLNNAANPLPQDSVAHWTQYKRVSHRLVSPSRIEIVAECETPDEHRVLRDWCQWISDETRLAPALLASPGSDPLWNPPTAKLDGPDATIIIKPKAGAKYRAVDWRFELDEGAVIQRLVKDVYDAPLSFVRELIQNSLDATRCKLYDDLQAAEIALPAKPTAVSKSIRQNYPILISLKTISDSSNGESTHQVLEVSDSGIGMNEEILRRFFLQVGRSYYGSESFKARYRFSPTSMFGIGFLSVFAVSDSVEVSTLRIEQGELANAQLLRLYGPRNYIILEQSDRKTSGTTISVRLKGASRTSPADLIEFVSRVCAKSEFPIEVETETGKHTVWRDTQIESGFKIPDHSSGNSSYVLRQFQIEDTSIEGELYIVGHIDAHGIERWDTKFKFKNYLDRHPEYKRCELPDCAVFYQGILLSTLNSYYTSTVYRIDIRDSRLRPNLSRSNLVGRGFGIDLELSKLLSPHWHRIIDQHLKAQGAPKGDDAWKYYHRLAKDLEFEPEFWDWPGFIPTYLDRRYVPYSVEDFRRLSNYTEVHAKLELEDSIRLGPSWALPSGPYVLGFDFVHLEYAIYRLIVGHRRVASVLRTGPLLQICWEKITDGTLGHLDTNVSYDLLFPCQIPDADVIAIAPYHPYRGSYLPTLLLNLRNPVGVWIQELSSWTAEHGKACPQTIEYLRVLRELLRLILLGPFNRSHDDLRAHIETWTSIADRPSHLSPPSLATLLPGNFSY